jgi:S-formylglutathione hydrolase
MQAAESHLSYGGTRGVYTHRSKVIDCDMTLAIYTPPTAADCLL